MPKGMEIPTEPTKTDKDLRDIIGRPDVEDDSLNKLENEEMTDNEKNVAEWIKKMEIKEGTVLIVKAQEALVTNVDFDEKALILDFEKRKNVPYHFERMDSDMKESENTVRIKESE